MSIFSNFKSAPVKVKTLVTGTWTVVLTKIQECDSFHNLDGSVKDKQYEWTDATPQLVAQFYCEAEKAWFTHRFNGLGYVLFDELTDKQLSSGKYKKAGRYAVDKDGHRIPDKDKTEKAMSILNDLFAALKMSEGSGVDELAAAIADKTALEITIESSDYDGEEQFRIRKFRKHADAIPASFE